MEPIAIIGFSMRLPAEVNTAERFWNVLKEGRNVGTEWPESRINIDAFHHRNSNAKNTLKSRRAHFLTEDPGLFDAPFFSITAKEAAAMDPQQRLLLETSYRALENSGMTMAKVANTDTAVFEASMVDDYNKFMSKDPDTLPQMVVTGTAHAIMANRISWFFNLLGPSIHVDTACSSSMVAVDLACQSLHSRTSSMALVAGSNLILGPEASIMLTNMNFLSPDGTSYSFDHRANGYARGEGNIVIVLKRLSDAINDGDTIRSIIRATGSNQDGHTPGLTMPSMAAQERLIRSVYARAGLDFNATRYVEAHGTGTSVGDPIEIGAIGRVFRKSRSAEHPLYVGSVKANIGHLEGASGLAGIVKAVLMIENGLIPPQAVFEKTNPNIDAEFYNIKIPQCLVDWPSTGVRRISVNSFGFGGTNSHAIIDDAFYYIQERALRVNHCMKLPLTNGFSNGQNRNAVTNGFGLESSSAGSKSRLLIWSAADEHTLRLMMNQYMSYYEDRVHGSEQQTDKLAFTLSEKRSKMLWRCFALADPLSADRTLKFSKPFRSGPQTGIAFVFTGQGAQYADMGIGLLRYPIFRETLTRADKCLANLGCTWSLFEVIRDPERLHRPEFSQPLCTALQLALVNLLRSFDIKPDAVVGHSSGEIAAAYTIGALNLESACKVAYYRGLIAHGRVKTASQRGAMLAANLAQPDVAGYVQKCAVDTQTELDVTLACINSPYNVTLSGKEEHIDIVESKLRLDGIFAQKVNTGVAYHSPVMEEMAPKYIELMGALEKDEANVLHIPMISTVTGKTIEPEKLASPQYWASNLASPVQFSQALSNAISAAPKIKLGTARSRPIYDLVEIGPHSTLRRPCNDIIKQIPHKKDVRYTPVLHRTKSSLESVLELVGNLFTYRYDVSATEANRWIRHKGESIHGFLVDAPQYPFNHTQRYWHESRLSLDYRLREPTPREVLGVRVSDWNPLEPKWRRMISVDELPWVADHVVNGSILYPATGTFIMALEAATQVAQKNRPITGFYVKEAIFSSPIVLKGTLEGDQTVETITSLRSLRKPYEKESAWSEIWISTYHNGTWSECFRATIQTQYAETSTQVDGGMEQEMTRLATLDTYHAAEDTCAHTILSDRFYDYCDKRGLRYGESFRILEDIRWDEGSTAIGRVDVSRASTHYQGLVHPAVIDAACQIFWIAPSSGLKSPMPTEVPHRFFDAYLSTSSWKYPQTTSIRIWSTSSYKPVGRGVQGALSMLSDDGSLLCRVKRVEMDPIADDDLSIDTDRKLLYGIDWEPCLSALEPSMLQQLCNINDESAEDEDNMQNYFKKLDEAIRFSIHSTLAELSEQDRLSMEPHLVRYTDWLQRQLKSHPIPEAQEKPADELEKIFAAVETMRPSWSMFMQVARNLTSILRGTVDPLSLIFSTDLAEDFYTDIFANICDTPSLRAFIELAAHENPELRILEVGAGTGGMTKHVLSALQQQEAKTGGNAFAEYVYSDISMAFFEKAKTKFDQFASRMSFKVIDLEEDIIIQAIEPKAYDIVVAGSVLHATETLHTTLKNIRKVLKPGGKLVFMELILPDALAMNFGFGVLPGWWRSSEDWRAEAQGVTEDRWNALLKDAGFSGNDLVLRDYRADELHNFSIIATTAVSEVATKKTSVVIVLDRASTTQRNMVVELRTWLLAHNEQNTVKTLDWKDLEEQGVDVEDIVISIVELDRPILHELDEGGFSCLRSLVGKSKKLLWVSSADLRFEQYSYHGLATGFFRTLRSEALDKQIVTLCLEGMTEDIAAVSQHIERIFQQSFIASDCEVEYVVRDNVLQVARLKEEPAINEAMLPTFKHRLRLEPFGEGPPLVFDAKNRGTLDSLEFSEDLAYQPGRDLGDYEVEVEAKCWGLNFRDVFIALGRLEENDLGFDCAGVVLRAGPRCRVKKGDRVVIAVIGCMRSYIICEELEVIRIPDSISFEDAAAICAPGVTAYHSLVDVARLQKGERILIHSASGATGQVAVQIAKWVGAEVFVTVGSDEKRQFLQDTYSIPRDHIFYSRNTSFAAGVMRMTGGEGVHVVLNSLSGDGLRVSWECVAEYGRFVEIGKVDIKSNSGLPMIGFSKNISFSAVDLFHISQTRKSITRHLLKATMSLYQDGHIHPPQPVHKFSVSKMEEAFRFFQTGKNTGRVVITIEKTDIVPKRIISCPNWRFDPNATYMIVGGLGGIGRAISRWMMSKGAKYLILPSRGGADSPAAIELVRDLEQGGAHVYAPTCDASNEDSLSGVLAECAKSMPPIKGCINAAMHLQDSIFEHMTLSQWNATVQSKVQTSWNLHKLLPKGLDFFILLSSLAGIYGSVSQANYSAGNNFQDALARYRTSQGEKAIAFNLGWMKTIGIIAETAEYQTHRARAGNMVDVETDEFFGLLQIYCDPAHPILEPSKSQLLVGVVTPADCQEQGTEVPDIMRHPLFSTFAMSKAMPGLMEAGEGAKPAILFKQAKTEEEKVQVVVDALAVKLGRALSMLPDDVDSAKPLVEYGVDSLVAVELRNWIGKEFSADVAVFDIMGGSTISVIGQLVAKRTTCL